MSEMSKTPVKKSSIIIVVCVILATILALVIALLLFVERLPEPMQRKTKAYALYIKDEELWYNDFSKTGAWQVTDQLFAGDLGIKDIAGEDIENKCFISKDGSTIYYPDHIGDDFDSITLYMRSLKNKDKEPVRIAKDVKSYIAAEDNSAVLYKDGEGNLYLFSIKKEEKEKVAKEVVSYAATADLNAIAYLEDGTLYLIQDGGDKVKMAGDVKFFDLSEDGSYVVYFCYDDATTFSIYKKAVNGDKVKIAEKAILCAPYTKLEAEHFYYYTSEKIEKPASELFEDDVPSDTKYDDFRKYLQDEDKTVSINKVTVYYFDGTKSTQIVESYALPMEPVQMMRYESSETGVPSLTVSYYEEPKNVIKFSSENDMSGLLAALSRLTRQYYALDVFGTVIVDRSESRLLDAPYREGNNVYLLKVPEDYDGEMEDFDEDGDLYVLNLETGEETLVFSGVDGSWLEIHNGKVYQLKDYDLEDGIGSFYIDDQWIADDVSYKTFYLTEGIILNGNKCYFATDLNQNDDDLFLSYWSIWQYDGQKTIHIADEVHEAVSDGSEGILYLTDISSKRKNGDLYRFVNGKSELIDEEVSYIFRTR